MSDRVATLYEYDPTMRGCGNKHIASQLYICADSHCVWHVDKKCIRPHQTGEREPYICMADTIAGSSISSGVRQKRCVLHTPCERPPAVLCYRYNLISCCGGNHVKCDVCGLRERICTAHKHLFTRQRTCSTHIQTLTHWYECVQSLMQTPNRRRLRCGLPRWYPIPGPLRCLCGTHYMYVCVSLSQNAHECPRL